jgi:cytochrome c oxidase subunit III
LASVAPIAEQFREAEQQRTADSLGMWLFLVSEVMLFGGFFMTLIFYRLGYPDAAKEASTHFSWQLGGINTAVLLTSSFTMAAAVAAARLGLSRWAARCLAATVALGIAFLAIKGFEYRIDITDGLLPGPAPSAPLKNAAAQIIVNLYYVSTGLHAVHLLGGIAMVSGLVWRIARGRTRLPERAVTVEMMGLYWHFVDVVWVFLYPTLYLLGR